MAGSGLGGEVEGWGGGGGGVEGSTSCEGRFGVWGFDADVG